VLAPGARGCHAADMAAAGDRYDVIGRTYGETRQEDPRIAAAIRSAVGPARSVVNVGAGSGSYEPVDCEVVAVEPSARMLEHRRERAAPALRAAAEHLPFPERSFDVAMAVLTVHHWSDPAAGLREMTRVADRQVVLFFEPLQTHGFWALDYFPAALDLPTEVDPPGAELLGAHLPVREIRTVLVPHDCRDGFGAAFWRRPEAYLDPRVQAGMSWLAMLPAADRRRGSEALAADLESGEWDRRHGHLRHQSSYDGGYRIAIAY
jgi:SAM-dependent methyltransferase